MFVLRWLLTFGVTVIAAFFTAVAARASGLFHIGHIQLVGVVGFLSGCHSPENIRYERLRDCRLRCRGSRVCDAVQNTAQLRLLSLVRTSR
jgi:hypothetical protein